MAKHIHSITLYLRPHTAQLIRAWTGKDENGNCIVSKTKVLGAVIYANLHASEKPMEIEYEYEAALPVRLTVHHESCPFDWRNHFSFIDRPSMKRIDKWVHDVFISAIYFHWDGARRKNRNESIRELMDRYGVTTEHVEIETLHMAVRRMEWDEANPGVKRPAGIA